MRPKNEGCVKERPLPPTPSGRNACSSLVPPPLPQYKIVGYPFCITLLDGEK